MKKLLVLFALLSLAAITAAPRSPTIGVVCTPTANGCAADQPFTLVGDGYSPKKIYDIIETSPGLLELAHSAQPDANGNIDELSLSTLPAGTYTISVFTENHNATPGHKELTSVDVIFE